MCDQISFGRRPSKRGGIVVQFLAPSPLRPAEIEVSHCTEGRMLTFCDELYASVHIGAHDEPVREISLSVWQLGGNVRRYRNPSHNPSMYLDS